MSLDLLRAVVDSDTSRVIAQMEVEEEALPVASLLPAVL